jgi:metal-responsive CopG/Arc/MetJ family transcriptional regulator
MKVALSIPDELFDAAEALAKRLEVSRSRLYATALADYVAKHRGRKTTERLNAVYADEAESVEPRLRRAQSKAIGKERW